MDVVEKVVFINRVAKVMKGGRRFHFTAVVVAGDSNGHVGAALGEGDDLNQIAILDPAESPVVSPDV